MKKIFPSAGTDKHTTHTQCKNLSLLTKSNDYLILLKKQVVANKVKHLGYF